MRQVTGRCMATQRGHSDTVSDRSQTNTDSRIGDHQSMETAAKVADKFTRQKHCSLLSEQVTHKTTG